MVGLKKTYDDIILRNRCLACLIQVVVYGHYALRDYHNIKIA